MPYAYSAIDDLLDKDGNATAPSQSNIFGAPTPIQGGTAQGQPPAEGQPKTVSEGTALSDVQSGGGGSASGAAPKPTEIDYSQAQSKSDRAAIAANSGKTAQPKALGDIQSSISANEKKLQDESNSYLSAGRTAQTYGVSDDDIGKATAAKKDEGAFANVFGLLGRKSINTVDDFKPSDIGENDVNLLGTQAGLSSLVSRGQDSGYTKGMGAFDAMSVRSSPGFADTQRSLQNQQAALQKSHDELGGTNRKTLETEGAANLAAAQKAARDNLGGRKSDLEKTNEQESADYAAAIAKLDMPGISQAALAKAQKTVLANLSSINPGNTNSIGFMSPEQAASFVTPGKALGASDFVSDDEAGQFNNIQALLGGGGQSWTSSLAHPEASANYSIDETGLQNALMSNSMSIAPPPPPPPPEEVVPPRPAKEIPKTFNNKTFNAEPGINIAGATPVTPPSGINIVPLSNKGITPEEAAYKKQLARAIEWQRIQDEMAAQNNGNLGS